MSSNFAVRPPGLNAAIESSAKLRGGGGEMSPPTTEWRSCSLVGGSLGLDQILRAFSAPISEEHAWAVIHQVGLVGS